MAQKKIKIGDNEITIRRATFGEVLEFPQKLIGWFDGATSEFEKEDFSAKEFLFQNIGKLTNDILLFCPELNEEELKKLDFVEVCDLVVEILAYNNLTQEKIKGFFGLIQRLLAKKSLGNLMTKVLGDTMSTISENLADHPMFQPKPIPQNSNE